MSGPEDETAVADEAKADARYRNGRAMQRVWDLTGTLIYEGNLQSRKIAVALPCEFGKAEFRDLRRPGKPSRHEICGPATDIVRRSAAVGLLTQAEAERLIQELEP